MAGADVSVDALAAAAAARLAAAACPTRRARSSSSSTRPPAPTNLNYARQLPAMVRTALAAGDPSLARAHRPLQPLFPLHHHALSAARAQLAEHAGDHAKAATLYADAADRWRSSATSPNTPTPCSARAAACSPSAGPTAEQPLREARDLFASMGYRPALAETNALLGRASTAAAS